jgi:predicted MPP superfamily phosphohydrolase
MFAALATVIAGIGKYLYFRWLVARVRFFARPRARRNLAIALAVVVLVPLLVRLWIFFGGPDRLAWIEGFGVLWGLALMIAAPGIMLVEWLRRFSAKTDPSRRDAMTALAGNAFIGAAIVPLGWGIARTRFDVEVVEIPIRIARLPRALDGFSIVQVSDIHVGAYLGDRDLRHAEELIRKLRADFVVMTGDLVHARTNYLSLATEWLVRLKSSSRFGMASILGNHEYYVGRGEVVDAFTRADLGLLINQSRVIAPGLELAGVDDFFAASSGRGPGPRLDQVSLSPDAAQILLCHQPRVIENVGTNVIDLQLSGHTHGGQIAPLGPLAVRAIYGHYKGFAKVDGRQVYINRGLGTSGPPSRVAVRPEITKIVLVSG